MKANYKKKIPITTTAEELETVVKDEINRLYDKIEYDIAAQFLSAILATLEIKYGWKQSRLRGFVDNLHATSELICGADIFGHKIDTGQLINHLSEKYGIDCRDEVRKM